MKILVTHLILGIGLAALVAGGALAQCDCDASSGTCSGNSVEYISKSSEMWGGGQCGGDCTADPSWSPAVDSSGSAHVRMEFNCEGEACQCGRYADGYYWVAPAKADGTPVSAVTITRMTPDSTTIDATCGPNGSKQACMINGWMEDWKKITSQCLDQRNTPAHQFASYFFDPAVCPNGSTRPDSQLPYQAKGGHMIFKTVSDLYNANCERQTEATSCTLYTVSLTIPESVPTDNGKTLFRPAWFGDPGKSGETLADRTYSTNAIPANFFPSPLLDASKIPSITRNTWSYEYTEGVIKDICFDGGHGDGAIKSLLACDVYGPETANQVLLPILRGMLSDFGSKRVAPWNRTESQQIMMYGIQRGIDRYHALKGGARWTGAGGWGVGRLPMIEFARAAVGDSSWRAWLWNNCRPDGSFDGYTGHGCFGATDQIYWSDRALNGQGAALFGCYHSTYGLCAADVDNYWNNLFNEGAPGSNDIADPHHYIDGGTPGESYQYCCTSQTWAWGALIARLVKPMGDDYLWPPQLQYVDRWRGFNEQSGAFNGFPNGTGRGGAIVDGGDPCTAKAGNPGYPWPVPCTEGSNNRAKQHGVQDGHKIDNTSSFGSHTGPPNAGGDLGNEMFAAFRALGSGGFGAGPSVLDGSPPKVRPAAPILLDLIQN